MEPLREVLAYRRLGFGRREIAELVDDPSADAVAHLHRLRGLLLERRDRADEMVTAVERELRTRAKGLEMTPEEQLNLLGARLYDTIGAAYTAARRTDPRIAAQIWDALGDARTALNAGAGTSSYEPADRRVTAVEPSAVMRGQRPPDSAPCVDAAAECLPFADRSFDAAMAVSTVHHWGTRSRGCAKCGVWPAAWWCSPSTPTGRGGRTGSGSPATTCPSSPVSSPSSPRSPGWPTRWAPAPVRCPRRSGARPVGLRRRPVRGVLAPAGGVSGGACAPCDVGVDEGGAGGGGACGTQSRRRPRLRPVGRTQRRPRRPRRGGSGPPPAQGVKSGPAQGVKSGRNVPGVSPVVRRKATPKALAER